MLKKELFVILLVCLLLFVAAFAIKGLDNSSKIGSNSNSSITGDFTLFNILSQRNKVVDNVGKNKITQPVIQNIRKITSLKPAEEACNADSECESKNCIENYHIKEIMGFMKAKGIYDPHLLSLVIKYTPKKICAKATCFDGIINQGELQTDCLGPCQGQHSCSMGEKCYSNNDCKTSFCGKWGFCEKTITDREVDTLVIVDTDSYNITEKKVKDAFDLANDLWLKPKTNFKFHIVDIIFKPFGHEQINYRKYTSKLIKEYFNEQNEKKRVDYVVFFVKDSFASIYGGFQLTFNVSDVLKEDNSFCTEFPPMPPGAYIDKSKLLAGAVIDFGHKYGACGYDENSQKIISNVSIDGQCRNQPGLTCIWQNGYQMCPNVKDDFAAQGLNSVADTIVHELLHSYSLDDMMHQHFTTKCGQEILGWDYNKHSWDYYNKLYGVEPFGEMSEEYAEICPYVWKQFINSQKDC